LIEAVGAAPANSIPSLASRWSVTCDKHPDQEPALYLTAVVLGLFLGALSLLVLVLWQSA
jgi:hypothetical protein